MHAHRNGVKSRCGIDCIADYGHCRVAVLGLRTYLDGQLKVIKGDTASPALAASIEYPLLTCAAAAAVPTLQHPVAPGCLPA